MECARAIALYGKIIYPEECNYSSYKKLGLRCPSCGEPVHLKQGRKRKPHFAHFSGTDPNKHSDIRPLSFIWEN